jgi:hypothetical protein
MDRLYPKMNLLTTSFVAAFQEPTAGKPLTPLVALTLLLVCGGFIVLIIRSQEQEKATGQNSSFTILLEGFLGCIGAIIKFAIFIAVVAAILFAVIKAVKYAWFF